MKLFDAFDNFINEGSRLMVMNKAAYTRELIHVHGLFMVQVNDLENYLKPLNHETEKLLYMEMITGPHGKGVLAVVSNNNELLRHKVVWER